MRCFLLRLSVNTSDVAPTTGQGLHNSATPEQRHEAKGCGCFHVRRPCGNTAGIQLLANINDALGWPPLCHHAASEVAQSAALRKQKVANHLPFVAQSLVQSEKHHLH